MNAKTLQETLGLLRYYKGPITGDLQTTVFRAALKIFQSDKGLTIDGWVGPQVEGAIARFMTAGMPPLEELRKVRLTHYYIAEEKYYPGDRTVPVYHWPSLRVIARVSARMFAAMSLEGTGKTLDGRLFNVAGKGKYATVKAAEYAAVLAFATKQGWIPDKAGYAGIRLGPDGQVAQVLAFTEIPENRRGSEGYGIQRGESLRIARSLATDVGSYGSSDPRFIGKGGLVPAGTQALVVDLIGTLLPDGTVHDGHCLAHDTGGAIFGMHYDVFCGNASLAQQIRLPAIGHTWFPGIVARVDPDYTYGLVK